MMFFSRVPASLERRRVAFWVGAVLAVLLVARGVSDGLHGHGFGDAVMGLAVVALLVPAWSAAYGRRSNEADSGTSDARELGVPRDHADAGNTVTP
jgi:hypothetical protein